MKVNKKKMENLKEKGRNTNRKCKLKGKINKEVPNVETKRARKGLSQAEGKKCHLMRVEGYRFRSSM